MSFSFSSAASVSLRPSGRVFLILAKKRIPPFELLLTRHVLERLLYRLSLTRYREQFILKGAILMTTWFDDPLRPTRGFDRTDCMLGRGLVHR
jgi:hypothetical protein